MSARSPRFTAGRPPDPRRLATSHTGENWGCYPAATLARRDRKESAGARVKLDPFGLAGSGRMRAESCNIQKRPSQPGHSPTWTQPGPDTACLGRSRAAAPLAWWTLLRLVDITKAAPTRWSSANAPEQHQRDDEPDPYRQQEVVIEVGGVSCSRRRRHVCVCCVCVHRVCAHRACVHGSWAGSVSVRRVRLYAKGARKGGVPPSRVGFDGPGGRPVRSTRRPRSTRCLWRRRAAP